MQRFNATLNKNLPEMKGIRRSAKLPALCALVLCSALTACSGADESSAAQTDAVVLPVSLNEVMVALINKAADPLWAAAV